MINAERNFMDTIIYKNNYVNHNLIALWSDDEECVKWYNPVDKKGDENKKIDSLHNFIFNDYNTFVPMQVGYIDDCFDTLLDVVSSGNVSIMDSYPVRNAFLFQYLRNPSFYKRDYSKCTGEKALKFLNRFKGRSYFLDVETDLHLTKDYLRFIADMSPKAAVEILDLKAVLLRAPEGSSFILGSDPLMALNPYFEKRFAKTKLEDRTYDLTGVAMVLPVTPDISVMLYDDGVYDINSTERSLVLSKDDVDIINKVEMYNSDIDGGVVYKDVDREYLDDLSFSLGVSRYRAGYGWFTETRYPFTTLLSVLSIRKSAADNIAKNAKAPVRDYVLKIRQYVDNHESVYGKNLGDLLKYASSLLE